MSPLAQGRGLKRGYLLLRFVYFKSPLAQGRGLKLFLQLQCPQNIQVAPCTGAWIETVHRLMCP